MPSQKQLIEKYGKENLPHILTAENWEELTEQEKNRWEEIAQKYPNMLKILSYVQKKGCPICKFRPKSWDEFEFHIHSTHGIPRGLLVEYLYEN